MRNLKRAIIFAIVFSLFPFGIMATAGNPPSDYFIDELKLPFEALPGAVAYWGIHKNAGYRVEVPVNWNGDLVLYCHGYRGTGPELTVGNPSIRNYLIENGYAWAASSYSTNKYDVKAGVKDTHALGKYFNGLVGKPNRVYVMGHSLGGHVTAKIIEQYKAAYDGALPMCGVMGDTELYDYFLSYQLVAQAIAGIDAQFPSPPDKEWNKIVDFMREQFGDSELPFPDRIGPLGEKLRTIAMYLSGGKRPLFDVTFSYGGYANYTLGMNLGDGTRDIAAGNMMENIDTVYQLDGDPALTPEEEKLNAMVLRVEADPQGKHPHGLANIPPVQGNPSMPVLSLHTIGDMYVPLLMQQVYAERVIENGKADLVVFRVVRDIGHCGFTLDEQEVAFGDLVNWVENGIKPEGDDVLTPAVVANDDYGCTFTSEQRSYDLDGCQ
jgi:pimeloyl-ACP methyl ester carboxylesterase